MKKYNPNPVIIVAALTAAALTPMIAEKKKDEESHCHTEVEKDCWYGVQSFGLYAMTSTTSTTTTTTTMRF